MARTELPNGVILPAEYSDDWYEDMTSNLTKLDDVIGSDSEKLNADGVYFLRMSSAALTDSGTGNFSDLNSSYKIKTGDLVLDSGRKLYRIVSVDSTNETFTVGNSLFKVTAESDLAPVATSGDYGDLDNKPDLKPVATSGDYDDLTGLPTYGITRLCSSAITDNSTVAFSAISSTNKIKAGDFLLDTNGKLYQISSVDTANETVSVTTPLTVLALDANVMHLSGDETAAGIKTFSDDTYIKSLNFTSEVPSPSSSESSIMPIICSITYGDSSPAVRVRLNIRVTAEGDKAFAPHDNDSCSLGYSTRIWSELYAYHGIFRGRQQGDEYSSNARTNLTLLANRDSVGQSGCVVDTFRENTTQGIGSHILGIAMKENSVRYQGCRFSWSYDNDNNGYVFSLRPTKQGTIQPIKYELGNSLSKWDTINGLNPGALSLPDTSNALDISGYITDLTGSANTYTALADGYVSIRITGTAMRIAVSNGVESSCQRSASGAVACYVPVVAGETVSIYAVGTSINNAIFRPCLGNV